VIGRGFGFPPALEIALKLKETSYTRAEPFSAADFLHGPVALVEPTYSALLIDVGGQSSRSALELAAAIRQRGGQPALLRAGDFEALSEDVPNLSLQAPISEPYAPIVALVLGQLVAVELALAMGLDPARPRGLRKVTSTR
jgi:glucosamine--fructose-6-phosphate aminotransferase (isomerizing)